MAAAGKTTPLTCTSLARTWRLQTPASVPVAVASRRRCLHTRRIHSTRQPASAASTMISDRGVVRDMLLQPEDQHIPTPSRRRADSPLSKLPIGTLLRSLIVQRASSVPLLFKSSVSVLSLLAETKSVLLSPKSNPMLKKLLRICLYDMFCAGENGPQVSRTARSLQSWGVQGVMLSWAREFVFKQGSQKTEGATAQVATPEYVEAGRKAIQEWGAGNLRGVELATPGDIVALKLSGAGPLVLDALQTPELPFDDLFLDHVHQICSLAKSKGVFLCVDAEQQRLQSGIDALSMRLSRRYNGSVPGSAVIMNTYQAYLKSAPAKLSEDLHEAAREGFCLGVKLVRGAYLQTEDRSIIWDTKEDTDAAFDALAEGVMRRDWAAGGYLSSGGGSDAFPAIDLMLATHNLPSVRKACAIRLDQIGAGQTPVPLTFAQLMGMADDVTAAAIKAARDEAAVAERQALKFPYTPSLPSSSSSSAALSPAKASHIYSATPPPPRVYKYLAWGSVDECLKYLVRRAQENKDAASRTQASCKSLWEELKRRLIG